MPMKHPDFFLIVRQPKRWGTWGAVAAVLAIALTISVRSLRTIPSAVVAPVGVVARLQNVIGTVAVADEATRRIVSDGAGRIVAGEGIETAPESSASLAWGGGTLRIDESTTVRFDSDRSLFLERGTLYVSSENGKASGVSIGTPSGTVHDIGTQFEVRFADDGLRVRVREGRIDLQSGGAVHVAEAGMALIVADSSGAVRRESISKAGTEWGWIERAAPPMSLEGISLQAALASVAREKGLTIVWPDALERRASTEILHGSLPLTTDEALEAASAAAGVSFSIEGDRLVLKEDR